MPLPTAVPRCSWKRSIAARMSSRFDVGGCTTDAVAANDTMPIRVELRLVGDEARARQPARPRCGLGSHVGGPHAAGHVHGEDDDLVPRRQRQRARRGARSRRPSASSASRNRKRRNVAPEPLTAAERVLDHAQTCVAERELSLPPQHQPNTRRRRTATPAASHSKSGQRNVITMRQPARCRGKPPPRRAGCGACANRRNRRIASTRSPSVESSSASTPALPECRPRSSVSRRAAASAKRLRNASIMRVDEDLLARLGILDRRTSPRSGSSQLQRIVEPHGEHLVAPCEARQRLRPTGRAEEIGDEEHERAPLDDIRRRLKEIAQVRSRRSVGARGATSSVPGCAARDAGRSSAGSRCPSARRRRSRRRDCRGASAVAPARVTKSIDTARFLTCLRAEVDRRAQIEQKPRGDFAVLVDIRGRTASTTAR